MTYIFVYGTLKRGEHNSSLLDDCKYVGSGRADCFVILDLGGCPGLVPGKTGNNNSVALGEIYAVPDDKLPHLLGMLDRLENNGRIYVRVKISVTHIETGRSIECITYLLMFPLGSFRHVENGNWSLKRRIKRDRQGIT